jgi:GTP pyrophosphokinase
MQRKRVEISDLFDVRAVRVLVHSLPECYAALGVVHSTWQHIPNEFDDYIANPKENGYQSLHTAVIGPEGKAVEVQIRTRQMNDDAELGVAAHWLYKEGGAHDDRLQRSINSLRTLLEGEGESDVDLVASFKGEMFSDRVFVLTPKGKILDLPSGATPLDFAYQVHTEIGHRCRGAKVNGMIVPLNHQLSNGETVEILTTREPKPSRDWLNRNLGYLVSTRSRAKVRHWFNIRDHEQHIEDGKVILERELKRLNASSLPLEKLVAQLRYERGSDLFAAIGRNDVNSAQIASAVYALERPPEQIPGFRTGKARKGGGTAEQVSVRGVGKLLTTIATCCQPVPYDGIVGYITRGKGVTVHRRDCPNILKMDDERRERLIDVAWGEEHGSYPVDLRLLAYDRHGLIRDVSAIMANEDLNVTRLNTETDPRDQMVDMRLTIEIESVEQLSRVMDKLRQLSNVMGVERRGSRASETLGS